MNLEYWQNELDGVRSLAQPLIFSFQKLLDKSDQEMQRIQNYFSRKIETMEASKWKVRCLEEFSKTALYVTRCIKPRLSKLSRGL